MAVSSLAVLGWAVGRLPSPLILLLASNALGSYGESVPIGQLRVLRVFWSWSCSMRCEPWEFMA